MPLNAQTVALQLRSGVETKSDEKSVIAGRLLELENGVFTRPGAVRKRNGYNRVLSKNVLGGGVISAGQALAMYGSELLMADAGSLYSYNPSADAWVGKGSFVSAHVTQRAVVRNTQQQTAADSAHHSSGLQCFAWEDSSGGVRYSVIDSTTGAVIVNDALVDVSGSRPKVLALGPLMLVFWVNGTSLKLASIAAATPQTLGVPATITTGLTATPSYDAHVIGERAFVCFATATGFSVTYYLANLTSITPVAVATTSPTAMSVFEDSLSQNAVVAWYDGTAVKAQAWDYGLATSVMATQTVDTIANVTAVTGAAIPGASSSLRLFYSVSAANPYDYLTRTATITAYGAASVAAYLRSVSVAGKAFSYGSRAYVLLAHQSTLQSTYFVADHAGLLAAKLLHGLGGGLPTRTVLPEVNALSATEWQFACLAKFRLSSEGGTLFTLTGVNSVSLDFFEPSYSYSRAELGQALHFGGGFLSMYDGAGVVEHGFHLYPENVSVANLDSDTGTANTYGYKVVYAWTDNQGQIHRSAPSPAVSWKKLSPIDGTHRTTVTIPTLRLTAKQSPRRKVICEVYRTEANGTVYYLVSSASSPTYNDSAVDTVTFTDAVTDAVLIGNPQIYTTGEVENVEPGPVSSTAIHQNRIIALDSMNPLQLWWSKPVVPGFPVEFSDVFVQNIDPVGGDIVAIARMDAWLVLFKDTAIFVTGEDGPAANGVGAFSSGTQVPSSVGCADPRSLDLTQNGIVFRSSKGWHLLTRDLRIENITDVAAWATERVTSALTMPGTFESRFTLASGIALVNDDLVNQWGTFSNVAAVDAVIWQGLHTYLRADGEVRQETPGVFADAGQPIRLRLKTSWLQFAGISGFQRVRRLLLLGDYVSPHVLTCRLAYDFDSEPAQIVTVDAASLENPVYGEDSVYGGAAAAGDSLVYGGAFPAYSWRISTQIQKCSALQITLEETETTPGEGASFASLAFDIAVKPGTRRVPAARSA